MLDSHGLRFRISVTFFVLAGILSALFAWAVELTMDHVEMRYVESTLAENLELMLTERHDHAERPVLNTASMTGYVVSVNHTQVLPSHLRSLGPGFHEYEDEAANVEHQILVKESGGLRYVLSYDSAELEAWEETLEAALLVGVVAFALIALWLGRWGAGRIIAPVTSLARQIHRLGHDLEEVALEAQWGDDEVAALASAFEQYMQRVHALMRRERELTANVSHELRTPIMVASSSAELLLARPDLDGPARQHVLRMKRALRQMANLTDAFLILGREPPRAAVETAECPVEPILQEVIDFRRETAEQKKLGLHVTVEGNPTVRAPKTAVSVVIDNLLGNALSYTEAGEVAIRLDNVGVTVSDTGPGIPDAERALVFEREFRGRGVSPGGAGLGLFIVRALCTRYGWTVTLESDEGSGTTAHVDFTRAAPASR